MSAPAPGIRLKGMTWRHPRGYDPLLACAADWQARTGVAIDWDQRSLQDFESFPVEQLARDYDLLVIDHPHVGQVADEGCLVAFDPDPALAAASVGPSYPSYNWRGHQWALPIDAATQVQAWRPDRLPAPPARWEDILPLARDGRVLLPLKPPHSLMCLYTLAANLGHPCATDAAPLVDPAVGARVYDMVAEVAALVDPACFDMNPIDVLEAMADPAAPVACSPLIYGYVSYAIPGVRPARIGFADIPVAGDSGPVGSALGGTGIAVSAFGAHDDAAVAFARWVAGAEAQAGRYAAAGGQPGHAAAWEDDAVNAAAPDFYRATRATLEGAWLRPRHTGYMAFQHAAATRLTHAWRTREPAAPVIADVNALFAESFA